MVSDVSQMKAPATRPVLGYLPKPYTFRNGTRSGVRNSTPDDDRILFSFIEVLPVIGVGFAVDEYPTYEYFERTMLNNVYGLVFEEVDSKKLIAFVLLA